MTATERLDLVEQALERSTDDEETVGHLLRILLEGQKLRHLRVRTTPAGSMKTDIAVELNGIELKTGHFVYDTGNGVCDVRDDYSRNYMKRVHR